MVLLRCNSVVDKFNSNLSMFVDKRNDKSFQYRSSSKVTSSKSVSSID